MRVLSVALLAVDRFATRIPDAKTTPSVFDVMAVNSSSCIELIQTKASSKVEKKPVKKKAGKKSTDKLAAKSKQTAA